MRLKITAFNHEDATQKMQESCLYIYLSNNIITAMSSNKASQFMKCNGEIVAQEQIFCWFIYCVLYQQHFLVCFEWHSAMFPLPWVHGNPHYAQSDPRGNQTYEILMGSSARERIRREQQTHRLTPELFYQPWRNICNSKNSEESILAFHSVELHTRCLNMKQYGTAWVRMRGPACEIFSVGYASQIDAEMWPETFLFKQNQCMQI